MQIPDYYPDDARVYLREELETRKRRRPQYSLRAFARDLEMSPSFLCEFLAGRQGLSRERVNGIAQRLQLTADQSAHFWDLIEARFGRNPSIRKAASLRATKRTRDVGSRLSLERFRVIARWYHFALLELLALDGETQLGPKDLAAILDLPLAEVKEALARLSHVGLAVRDEESGRWIVKDDVTVVGDDGPDSAVQLAHQEMLAMHARAVEARPFEARESLSVVFSLDRAQWPAFKRELKDLLVSLMGRYAHEAPRRSQVVCLSTQALALLAEAPPAP